jgi:hypothetical protein
MSERPRQCAGIARAADMPASAAGRLAGEVVAAIRAEIVRTGRQIGPPVPPRGAPKRASHSSRAAAARR